LRRGISVARIVRHPSRTGWSEAVAAARRSYWFAQESLLARLRRQGDRFRPVQVLGHRLQVDITDRTGRMHYFYGARAILEASVNRNGVSACVEIVALALADTSGSATLFEEEANTAHSTIEPLLSPMRLYVTLRSATVVHMTTLDEWMASHPELLRRVRCVKTDVEGAEARP